MSRMLVSSIVLATCAINLPAQELKKDDLSQKPPYERMLKGEDAKKAAELQEIIERASGNDDYTNAIKVSEELLALRTKVQGADHWEAILGKSALTTLQKVAALPAEKRQGWREASIGANEASDLQAKGRYAQALPLWKIHQKRCQEVLGEEHADTATCYDCLAGNFHAQGRYAEALQLFQKALEIRRKVLSEDHPDTATSYSNAAVSLNSQLKYAEAQPLLQKSLDIRLAVLGENHPDTAESYGNVAGNLNAQGKSVEAQPLYQKALDISRKVLGEEHPDTAASYNGVAANLNSQGKYAEARPLYLKALEIRRKVVGEDHPDTATSYNNVALNLLSLEKPAEAQPLFQRALDIRRRVLGEAHPDTAASYNNLAGSLNNQAKFAEAQPLFKKALDLRLQIFGEDHPDTAASYNNVAGNLDDQGKYTEAQPLFQKVLDFHRKVLGENHPRTSRSYNNLTANLSAQGKYPEAQQILERAVHSYEASRLTGAAGLGRASLDNLNPRLLLAAIQSTLHPQAAWTSVEMSLARGLLDQQTTLATSTLTATERAEQTLQRKMLADAQARILVLATKPKRTAEESQSLDSLLAQRRAADERMAVLAVTVSQREVASPEEIRHALPADAALLFWIDVAFRTGKVQEHWACVVRRTGAPKWERLPGTGPEQKWSNDDAAIQSKLRTALSSPTTTAAPIEAIASNLHAQRIAPILKHLDGVKTLYVVPVNEMAGIPIEVLTRDYTIGYVPSGTFLARRGKSLDKPTTLLAIGDPAYPKGTAWDELPGTSAEVASLGRIVGPSNITSLTRSDASEQKLDELRKSGDLKKYRYLHFATHGKGNNVRAFESALILAQDKLPKDPLPRAGEPFMNGQLSANEVLEFWKLDADMVTLSACETAIGKSGGGDGLLGFAQAFLVAGSRSVCLSLWKVDDTATALFMDRFYRNRLGKREDKAAPMGKAAALSEAKNWLRNLTLEEATNTYGTITKDVVRSEITNAKIVGEIPKPTVKEGKPFSHPKYWAAFILIGDPD